MISTFRFIFVCLLLSFGFVLPVEAQTLQVGAARTDITPSKSVPLMGQFHLRLSQRVETPLTANVVALEATGDSAIFVSCDLLQITDDLARTVRKKVAEKDATIDVTKIVFNGTHTHTAPALALDDPKLPKSDEIMDYPESIDFTAGRLADAVVDAWKNRKPGKMAYGLDYAVVGWSRRIVYADGSAQMYGNTNRPEFREIENMEDHDVGTYFFWDENDSLLAAIINVACPSQVVEHRLNINADFWHPVRENLAKRLGENVIVLGWCSAAGDIAPRPMYRKDAVARMNALRKLDEMSEIARKLDRAVADSLEAVKETRSADVILRHRIETLQLPMRKITEQEYTGAKTEVEKIVAQRKANPDKADAEIGWMGFGWHGNVVKRYEMQQANPDLRFPTTIHVIRLGETVVCTNQFELYTDFGIRIKARSPARQTFLVQLAGNGTYLPTERAVRGGSYSAIVQSTPVGPEGGQVLVEETVKIANELFK